MIESIPAKTIVTRTKAPGSWFGIDYNMNIYRGCSHGCIYCDSRSDCYRIDDFDRVRVKQDALRIIRDDLRRKVRRGVVGTGAMSDPYNPAEQQLELTRHALELLGAYGFGAAIATKSDLILRDIDLLREIAVQAPVLCKITVTTCDAQLAARVEPGAPPPARRLEAVAQLREAGLFAGILLMPVLPFLEDSAENVLEIVREAGQAGANFIYPAFGMTLRDGQREWYFRQLESRFPGEGLAERYAKRYGRRYTCTSPSAASLWKLFSRACTQAGIVYRMEEIIRAYKMGHSDLQLSLF